MKKISTLKELQLKKRKFKLNRYELEKELYNNWNGLRGSLSPVQIASDMFKMFLNIKRRKRQVMIF